MAGLWRLRGGAAADERPRIPKVAEPRNEITKKRLTKRREKFCVRALQSPLSAVDEWFWSKTKQSDSCLIWPEKAATAKASGTGKRKLTERDVRFIRRLAKLGAKRKAIGALFGVSHETIKAILSGRTWKKRSF